MIPPSLGEEVRRLLNALDEALASPGTESEFLHCANIVVRRVEGSAKGREIVGRLRPDLNELDMDVAMGFSGTREVRETLQALRRSLVFELARDDSKPSGTLPTTSTKS